MRNSVYGGGLGGPYGSVYGGLGGMYGGMGQPGMMGTDPNDPNSLTNTFSQSTQATFQIIESIVGAFQGVAQMLESTYMATHSSFFGEHHNSSLLHPTLKPISHSHGLRRGAIYKPP
jgi:peroxin-13